MRKRRTRGKGLFKEQWMSICSMHYHYNKDCKMCQAGQYRNIFKMTMSSLFYKLSPTLWRILANRPWSPDRKFLESIFPNLKND